MADNVRRKRSGSATLKQSRGKSKSEEMPVGDGMTIGAMEDKIVASGKPMGEISIPKTSQSGGEVQVIGGEVLTETDPNVASKGIKKNNADQAMVENEENSRILKQKRGADAEMVLAYLSSQERSSSRLRPRQVPTFRMVDLGDDDGKRIVDKRVKVYWPDSRKWFTGRIKAFDDNKGLHSVLYDDGDKEELDLRKERFQLEILPSEGFNLSADSISRKKVRGLDANEVSSPMLPETALKIGDAKEVMKSPEKNVDSKHVVESPEAKMKDASKVGRRRRLKLLRNRTKVEEDDFAAEIEKMNANMEVNVQLDDEVEKGKAPGDLNVKETVEDESETLEEVDKKNGGSSKEAQATIVDVAAKKKKVNLEDGNVSGDMEDKEQQAKTENITASEDAIISSNLSSPRKEGNMEDQPPNVDDSIPGENVDEGHADTIKNDNDRKLVPEAAGEAAREVPLDLQQPQMASAVVLTGESARSSSKLHLPKNPKEDHAVMLQEKQKVEKGESAQDVSKKEMDAVSQKTLEGGKPASN